MANRTFRLKPAADANLVSIFRYTSDEWGTYQAEEYLLHLNDAFRLLAEQPFLGRAYDIVKSALRGHSVQSHVIFYRPTDYGVVIIRLLHQAMDYTEHL